MPAADLSIRGESQIRRSGRTGERHDDGNDDGKEAAFVVTTV